MQIYVVPDGGDMVDHWILLQRAFLYGPLHTGTRSEVARISKCLVTVWRIMVHRKTATEPPFTTRAM